MKKTLLAAVAILCTGALAANAQSYQLEFAADASGGGCALASGGVGLTSVHVILTGTGSVTALQFGAQIPACWQGATWIADNLAMQVVYPDTQNPPEGKVWLAIGDTQVPLGLSVAFGECVNLPLYIGHVDFMGTAPAPCCEFVTTHPSAWAYPTPAQVVDCNFNAHDIPGGSVRVSAGPECPCQLPLATEQRTWGGVKALYR